MIKFGCFSKMRGLGCCCIFDEMECGLWRKRSGVYANCSIKPQILIGSTNIQIWHFSHNFTKHLLSATLLRISREVLRSNSHCPEAVLSLFQQFLFDCQSVKCDRSLQGQNSTLHVQDICQVVV